MAERPSDRTIPALKDAVSESELLRQIYWLREVIETRLNGMDKALELIQAKADKVPSDMDLAIDRLKELHESKFISGEKAVSTAFVAAERLVNLQSQNFRDQVQKSDAATTKQIDSIGDRIGTLDKTVEDKIGGLKERVGAIENIKKGSDSNWGVIGAIISGTVGIILIFGFVVTLLNRPVAAPSPIIIERPAQAAGSSGVNVTTP